MGTNFYLRETSIDSTTGRKVSNDVHIGKASYDWTFSFQGENFKTVDIWKNVLSMMTPNMEIVNEYGVPYTSEEFWTMVGQTRNTVGKDGLPPRTQRAIKGNEWIDDGFHFYAGEFC
jgi:hypothetical protein